MDIRKRNDDGFTLIEILIVIVILGVLATVVVFSVRGISDNGQDAACATDNRALSTAVEAYFAKYTVDSVAGTVGDAGSYEVTLQSAGLIREPSEYWDVQPNGELYGIVPCPVS